MPDDILGVVHDKSSWARRGLTVQNTLIEPGWRGFLTLEITNHSHESIVLKRGMAIAQVVFHRLDEAAERPYSGKYQGQGPGPQEAR
jgi:dCTP deaminase